MIELEDQVFIKMSIEDADEIFAGHFLKKRGIKTGKAKYLKMLGKEKTAANVNEINIRGIYVENLAGAQLEIPEAPEAPITKGRRKGVQKCTLPLLRMNGDYSIDILLGLVRKTPGMESKTWPDGMQSVSWDYFHGYIVGPNLKHLFSKEGRGIRVLGSDSINIFYKKT